MIDKNKTKVLLLIVAMVCFAFSAAFAQGPGFDDDVVDTPIDGGTAFVVLAAAGYGYKKLVDNRKQNED